MNSETSTDDPGYLFPGDADGKRHPVSSQSASVLEPWQLFTLAGLIGATVVVFESRGETPAGILMLSLMIFTAAVVGIAAWRMLAPFTGLAEPVGPQMLGGRTHAALDREKSLVLRSIKELEFDRAMGKVSDRDFAEMDRRLRARAARLIRQLDAGASYREQIEKEIARRVGESSQAPAALGESVKRCPACTTDNDSDARFCKRCGASLEAAR